MLGYLSADIVCSEEKRFEEQIMSKRKYPNIFSRQMEAIVFIVPRTIVRNRRSFENWEILLGYLPDISWGTFIHVTRLDQSRRSNNIWRICHFKRNERGELQSNQNLITLWIYNANETGEQVCGAVRYIRKMFSLLILTSTLALTNGM